nr:nonstructural protein NS4A [Cacipacore virus]
SALGFVDIVGKMPQHFATKTTEAMDTMYMLFTAEKGGRAHRAALEELPEALQTIALITMLVLMSGGVMFLLIQRRGIGKIGLSAMTMLTVTIMMWWAGVSGVKISGTLLVSLLMVVVLVPEPEKQR